jgi:hypothetical protein
MQTPGAPSSGSAENDGLVLGVPQTGKKRNKQ